MLIRETAQTSVFLERNRARKVEGIAAKRVILLMCTFYFQEIIFPTLSIGWVDRHFSET